MDIHRPPDDGPRRTPATLLANGKVLVTGGGEEDTTTDLVRSATAEVYDPADGTWAKIRHMVEARGGHTATPLSDGTCSSQAAAPPPPSVTTRLLGDGPRPET